MSDETSPFKFGNRVEIGGRTMLRPGFSLVGLTGVIFPSAPNVPDGCLTVAVDWPGHGYTEENGYPEGTLPLFVNVPSAHLSDADAPEEQKPKPKWESKSELSKHLGKSEMPNPETKPEAKSEAKSETPDEDEGERPRLRLV